MSSELNPMIARRGMMIVLSSPSGAGKTTLARRLLEADRTIEMSISVTTRERRSSEIEGRDYFFVTEEEYRRMVKRGELLEHARVFDNWYGTPRKPVEEALAKGRDVLFDIDWQGAKQLYKSAKDDLVRIFVLPPSLDELEKRLMRRAEDSAQVVAKRMDKAIDEMSHWQEYDYIIVNDDIEKAYRGLLSIIDAERVKRTRQMGLPKFVRALMERR
jgi:guanylate kinase